MLMRLGTWLMAAMITTGTAWAQEPLAAQSGVPTLVEVFTSTLCPSCPGAEKKLAEKAVEDPNLMIVLQNVTYWDRDGQTDPYGNADLTQRQYDYSNTLGRRPGEVFTPQPILNGVRIAHPPLWISWDGAVKETREEPQPLVLRVEAYESGAMAVSIPKELVGKGYDLWVMGVHKEPNGLWRADSLANIPASGSRVIVPSRAVPNKANQALILLQEPGPGRVRAIGIGKAGRNTASR